MVAALAFALASAVPAALAARPLPAEAAVTAGEAAYRAEVEAWRREREARLRAPDGWLSLVALGWLHAGANRFGSAADDEIVLPAAVPPHAGTIELDPDGAGAGGAGAVTKVRARLAPGVAATLNGRALAPGAGAITLATDAGDATPDVLAIGAVTLQIIARGGRLAVRAKDPDSPVRRRFAGLAWFPIARAYRAVARLVPAAAPRRLVVADASGGRQELVSPGTLVLDVAGTEVRLVPVLDGPDDADLLVVFRDRTAGRETYGAGRFVRAHRQAQGTDGGAFVVDFNEAYSPPCAFTHYATCPLPPPENRIAVELRAGEKLITAE